jgi:predicted DNA-binding mobile mystery protein A
MVVVFFAQSAILAAAQLELTASKLVEQGEDRMPGLGSAESRRTARRALDRRFLRLRPLLVEATSPRGGWVLAIRTALGMSAADLAQRMGTTETAVLSLERNERAGRARFDTIARAADALGCDLVYVLVPRTSLDAIIDDRARTVATRQMRDIDHSMRLEAQGVEADADSGLLADHALHLRDRPGLWHEQ